MESTAVLARSIFSIAGMGDYLLSAPVAIIGPVSNEQALKLARVGDSRASREAGSDAGYSKDHGPFTPASRLARVDPLSTKGPRDACVAGCARGGMSSRLSGEAGEGQPSGSEC